MDNDILQIAQSVWCEMLGLVVGPAGRPDVPDRDESALAGWVQLCGAWEGGVAVLCSERLARRMAGVMFGVDAAAATATQVRDALGELTNMAAGNIKSLLPEPSRLSLPAVIEGSGYDLEVPGGRLKSSVALDCGGEPLLIKLMERSPDEALPEIGPTGDVRVSGFRLRGGRCELSDERPCYPVQREFSRVATHRRVVVAVDDHVPVFGESRDISLKGLYVRTAERPPVGACCTVRVPLADDPRIPDIEARGRIVREDETGFAVEFHEIGIQSYEHLRNLILHNATDPARIKRELDEHVGLKRRS